ncbi:MAG: hypothetical protein WCC36_08130 [Gammaproteobacteria bacterium]
MNPKGSMAFFGPQPHCGPPRLPPCLPPNHRLLGEQLQGLVRLARAAQQPLALLLVALGATPRPAGRRTALSQGRMVSAMQHVLGEFDMLVRLDDFDYAALLAGACATEARLIAHNLQYVLKPYGAAAIGLAVCPDDGTEPDALIHCACCRRAPAGAPEVTGQRHL